MDDAAPTHPQPPLALRPVTDADEVVVRAAQQTLAADRFEFAIGLGAATSWDDYLERLDHERRGIDLTDGRVPATFLLAEVEGRVVGRTSIRHRLNHELRTVGGHIGYGVLPPFRRRGYATEILRQSLVIARSHGVGPVLVTCDEGNEASAGVIRRCGGTLESVVDNPRGGARKLRFWIG